MKHGHSCGDATDVIDGKPTGAIRDSFGIDSIWEDVDALVTFIERVFVSSNLNGTAAIGNGVDNNCDDPWDDTLPRRVVVILSELYVFPIKSCAAQKVKHWELDTSSSSGKLLWDREFALLDASGNALRLQNFPAMADVDSRSIQYLVTFLRGGGGSHQVTELELESLVLSHQSSSSIDCGLLHAFAVS